jgi:diguanylate cyclase (GGDEF)-like protein
MTPTWSGARRGVARWAQLGASLALAANTVVLVARAHGEAVSSEERAGSAQTAELDEARRTLEAAALDIVVVRMLDGASFDGDRTDRLTSAGDRFIAATATIRSLASSGGPAAAEAAVLLDDLAADVLDDPTDGDLGALFLIAEDSARWAGNDETVTTRQAAIQQLSFVASVPLHAMVEGIAADISVNDRSVDPSIADFVEQAIDVVRTEGGWYGAHAASPLTGSEWIDIAEAAEMLPAAAQRLDEMTAASSLVLYDAWMRELGSSDVPAPVDVIVALGEADRLTAELSVVIDELDAEEAVERSEAFAARESDRIVLLGAAAASALIATALGVVAARSIGRARRSARDRATLAMRDALTGVGNRHELDDRTRALTLSPRFGHHVVAMVDLDRFKLVNDVYGHAAGDAVLVEIATRLTEAAARIASGRPDVETSVIRLGGDEFLFTAHSAHALDIDAIVAELDGARGDSVTYNGDRIDLAFSVGICHREGPHDLAVLMSGADLAAYDDKAARARARKTAAGHIPPPVTDGSLTASGSRDGGPVLPARERRS